MRASQNFVPIVLILDLTLLGVASSLPTNAAAAEEVAESIGPNSVSGYLTTFPAEPDRMLVVDRRAPRYWETRDGGAHWEVRTQIPALGARVDRVIADPVEPDRLWAIVVTDCGSFAGKLFVSDDDGGTWQQLPAPDRRYHDLDVHAGGDVLIATKSLDLCDFSPPAVDISRDGGETWSDAGITTDLLGDTALVGDSAYFSTDQGLMAIHDVTDPESTPELIFTPPSEDGPRVENVAGDDQVLFVQTFLDGHWVSLDQGATWEQVRPFQLGRSMIKVLDGELLIGYTSDVLRSTDFGQTWESIGKPVAFGVVRDAAYFGSGEQRRLHLSDPSGGVFRVEADGFARVGVPGVITWDVVAFPGGSEGQVLIAGTRLDTYQTEVSPGEPISQEWGLSGAEGLNQLNAEHLSASRSGVVYKLQTATFGGPELQRSTDNGESWEPLSSPLQLGVEVHDLLALTPAEAGSEDLIAVAVTDFDGDAVLVSSDGGESWQRTPTSGPILSLVAASARPEPLYGGGLGGIFVSTDGGQSFQQVNDQPVHRLSVPPGSPQHLVASFGGNLFTSSDGGQTLEEGTFDGGEILVHDVLYASPPVGSSATSGLVFAATGTWCCVDGAWQAGHGLLVSSDGGLTWDVFPLVFPDTDLAHLAIASTGEELYAAAWRSGIFRAPVPQDITLHAEGRRERGLHKVDLSWGGATSVELDVLRNGDRVTTVPNGGFHTDEPNTRGRARYTYQVCAAGTAICSNEVTVRFGGPPDS